jgi:hypothetical protein
MEVSCEFHNLAILILQKGSPVHSDEEAGSQIQSEHLKNLKNLLPQPGNES